MVGSSNLAIDISSDEESGYAAGGNFDDDHDWLSELLGEVNGNKEDVDGSDSDEVVFVSESFPKTLDKSAAKAKGDFDGDEDEDCVILDCDPEKTAVGGGDGKEDGGDDDDSDDLQIVGEKGEVACRDFPHSRHLCGMHLFASTPHEVHCSQCHCYVCDSIAPCDNWGTGASSIDHCHATDKEEFWRAERKSRKEGNNPAPLIPGISNPFAATKVSALSQPQPDQLLPNPVWRPTVLRPCSVPSNNRTTNLVNPGRCYPAGRSTHRYKPQQQFYSPELPPYNWHGTSSYNATNRNPRFYPSRVQFKRTGFRGSSENNSLRYFRGNIRSQVSGNFPLRRSPAFPATRFDGYRVSNEQGFGNSVGNSTFTGLESSFPPNEDVRFSNYMCSPPHIQSPPVTSFHLPSQPDLSNNNFLDVPPFQSLLPPFEPNNSLSAGSAFEYQLNSTSTVSSHPNMGNNFENHCYQPDTYDDISPLPTNGRNDFQLVDPAQSGLDTSAMYFGSDWHASQSHINSQVSSEEPQLQSAPADTSYNQSILAEDDHHQNMVPVENYNKHHVAPAAANSSVDASSCRFSGGIDHDQLDAQFESWMFANPSSPVAFEGPHLPYCHSPSPEIDSIAEGNLFD